MVFDHCQSFGGCSKALPGHLGVVVVRCVPELRWKKLCATFQPPRCESDLAAFEGAVDVLSDAHVHPSGHTQDTRMCRVLLKVKVSATLPMVP